MTVPASSETPLRPRLLDLPTDPSLQTHLNRHGAPPSGVIMDAVEAAGLRGRGGAWFPTARKWQAIAGNSSARRPPVAIANAMEGEPASVKDELLLRRSPHLILDGLALAATSIGATKAFVAVHQGSGAIPIVQRALAERGAARLDRIKLVLITPPARYVASEESSLVNFLNTGRALPTTIRPFERGRGSRTTLVQNAETLAHVALIARYGPDWFRSVGERTAPGTTLVTVTKPNGGHHVVEVATGTAVSHILGPMEVEPVALLTGGYGGSWLPVEAAEDSSWTPEGLAPAGGTVGAGVLVAFDSDACPVRETARVVKWMAGQSARQCGPCTYGLPSVSEDLALIARGHGNSSDLTRLSNRLGLVKGRGSCRHPDGVARLVASLLTVHAAEVGRHLAHHCSAPHPRNVLPIPGRSG